MLLRTWPAALALTCLLALDAQAPEDRGYRFEAPSQTIPGDVPNGGGAQWDFDFEPGGINNNGQVVYVGDMTLGGSGIGEGVFAQDRKGTFTTLASRGWSCQGM